MARLVVLYFMNLPSLQLLRHWILPELLTVHSSTVRFLVCRILGFRYELWKSGVNLIKIA